MNGKEILKKMHGEGFFTSMQTFEQYVAALCKRYTRIYGEILPVHDYDYIVERLIQNGIVEPQEASEGPLKNQPIYL